MKEGSTSIKSGLRWVFLSKALGTLVSTIYAIWILHYLVPEDYGLWTMAYVFIGFLSMIGSFATSSSIVAAKKMTAEKYSSLFWVKFFLAIVLSLVAFVGAGFVACYFDNSEVTYLVRILGVILIIQSPSFIYLGYLTREKNFKAIAITAFCAQVISSVISLYLAFQGWGVNSLLAKEIIFHFIVFICYVMYSGWLPKPVLNLSEIRSHLSFGFDITVNGVFAYFTRTIDDILIGNKFGSTKLGEYSRSYGLMVLPLSMVSKSIVEVMLPEISAVQNDSKSVKKIYLKSSRLVFSITSILTNFIYLCIEPIILFLELDKWVNIIPLVKIFTIISLMQCLGPLNDLIFQGTNKTRPFRNFQIVKNIFVVLSIILAVQFCDDIIEIAIVYAFLNFLTVIAGFALVSWVSEISYWKLLMNISSFFFATLIIIVMGSILDFYLASSLKPLGQVFIFSCFIILCFPLSLFMFSRQDFNEQVHSMKALFK